MTDNKIPQKSVMAQEKILVWVIEPSRLLLGTDGSRLRYCNWRLGWLCLHTLHAAFRAKPHTKRIFDKYVQHSDRPCRSPSISQLF